MKKANFREITIMNMILCFFVIFIHLISVTLIKMSTGGIKHIVMFSVNKMMCFSVPAFIFLSGFKLHNKYNEKSMKIRKFYFDRLSKIVFPYVFSVLIYYFYQIQKQMLSPANIPVYILLGTLEAHFYYIVIAVQSYLIFPGLKKTFDKFPAGVIAFSGICTVICKQFLWKVPYMDRFIGGYILYFVMGMVFSKYKIYEKVKTAGIISGILFAVIAVIHIRFSYLVTFGIADYVVYETVNILYSVCAITAMYSLCVCFKNDNNGVYGFSKVIGNSSFSIYLYHILIIHMLNDYVFPHYELSPAQQFVITSFVVIFSAVIYSYICYGINVLKMRIKNKKTEKKRIEREKRLKLKYFHKFDTEDIKTALDEYSEEKYD